MKSVIRKKGQVWVETVLYTLIGLAIIGLVLAFAGPEVKKIQDRAVIEQSIESMKNIDDKISEVLKAEGRQGIIELKLSKGEMQFNLTENKISWIVDSSFEYTQKDISIPFGVLNVITKQESGSWKVHIEKKYNNINLTGITRLDPAPTPYKLYILNRGDSNGLIEINFRAT